MNIMTWNINSVRLRAELVLKAADILKADVVCLQETKTPDEFFPHDVFEAAGFKYRHINGMKGYNGVAILSRRPFENTGIHSRVGREDCRHIAVKFSEFELHNLYIPAGGDIPDRDQNEKFGHKLDFVDDLTGYFSHMYQSSSPLMVVGDFNIAPFEHDVWSHKQLMDVVSHTPIEIEKLGEFRAGLKWIDVARKFIPLSEKHYTWWSYRNRDWKISNRGRRLDHIWVTEPIAPHITSYTTLPEARGWDKTSDHVPVMVELAL
jgi:exodeoxyribonuclease III